jgi:hypothetical protein
MSQEQDVKADEYGQEMGHADARPEEPIRAEGQQDRGTGAGEGVLGEEEVPTPASEHEGHQGIGLLAIHVEKNKGEDTIDDGEQEQQRRAEDQERGVPIHDAEKPDPNVVGAAMSLASAPVKEDVPGASRPAPPIGTATTFGTAHLVASLARTRPNKLTDSPGP